MIVVWSDYRSFYTSLSACKSRLAYPFALDLLVSRQLHPILDV
jgi:hypothetical protein